MGIERVKTSVQAKRYSDKFYMHSGYRLPPEMFLGNMTYIITRGGHYVGGLSVNLDSDNLRVLSQISGTPVLQDVSLKKSAEITGFWFWGDSVIDYGFFIYSLVRAVFLQKKKYFFYSYSKENNRLKKLYSQGRSTIVYSGLMTTGEQETVEYMTKTGLLLMFLHGICRKLKPKR